jgi:hypothetical protein
MDIGRVNPNRVLNNNGTNNAKDNVIKDWKSQADLYYKIQKATKEQDFVLLAKLAPHLKEGYKGEDWIGKPDEFLKKLPEIVVFPLYRGTETVTLIDDNPHATLWYITYKNGKFAYLELVIRRKCHKAFNEMAEKLGSENRVWICSNNNGSPSSCSLRPFQNIGFDVHETL